MSIADGELRIDSMQALDAHREEILRRINARSNGGLLFLVHPFACLRELKVNVGEELQQELRRRCPGIEARSESAYAAVREAPIQKHTRIRVRGLFDKGCE